MASPPEGVNWPKIAGSAAARSFYQSTLPKSTRHSHEFGKLPLFAVAGEPEKSQADVSFQ
jgi:hypothetical protein